jgi:hypothetical protein
VKHIMYYIRFRHCILLINVTGFQLENVKILSS